MATLTYLQRQVYDRCRARLRRALAAASDEQLQDALGALTAAEAIARLLLATPESPAVPLSATPDRAGTMTADVSTTPTALTAIHLLARLAAEVDRHLTADELSGRPGLRALLEEAEDFVAKVLGAASFDDAIRAVETADSARFAEAAVPGPTGYQHPYRRMDALIVSALFTPEEAAALSNTICGSEAAVLRLQERGLVVVEHVEDVDGERVAFFALSPRGEECVRRYFTVREAE